MLIVRTGQVTAQQEEIIGVHTTISLQSVHFIFVRLHTYVHREF